MLLLTNAIFLIFINKEKKENGNSEIQNGALRHPLYSPIQTPFNLMHPCSSLHGPCTFMISETNRAIVPLHKFQDFLPSAELITTYKVFLRFHLGCSVYEAAIWITHAKRAPPFPKK